jgi:alcohol dehydrogenase class IV
VAHKSQFAILTDTIRRVNIAIVSMPIMPDIGRLDPQTTVSGPDRRRPVRRPGESHG